VVRNRTTTCRGYRGRRRVSRWIICAHTGMHAKDRRCSSTYRNSCSKYSTLCLYRPSIGKQTHGLAKLLAVTSFQLCVTWGPIWLSQGPIWLSHFGPKDRSESVTSGLCTSVLTTEVTEDRSDRGPKWTCSSVVGPKWPRTEVDAYECWTLRLQDISPTRHFAYDMDTSPTGHFAYWTVRLLDISPTGHFAYSVDNSPTQYEHKRTKMCDIHYVPKKLDHQTHSGNFGLLLLQNCHWASA